MICFISPISAMKLAGNMSSTIWQTQTCVCWQAITPTPQFSLRTSITMAFKKFTSAISSPSFFWPNRTSSCFSNRWGTLSTTSNFRIRRKWSSTFPSRGHSWSSFICTSKGKAKKLSTPPLSKGLEWGQRYFIEYYRLSFMFFGSMQSSFPTSRLSIGTIPFSPFL